MRKQPNNKELPTVFCGECKHFIRDTSGPNYNNDTHEYFMGVCSKGLTPDTPRKQFSNKPRKCKNYENNR